MSILEDSNYTRQLDIIRPNEIPPVTLIGCGAAGSGVGIILAKMGAQFLKLWDGDRVEEHNIPNQYYGNDALGKYKVEALMDEMLRYTPREMNPTIETHMEHYTGEPVTTEYVFVLVDSLEARRDIFTSLRNNHNVKWLIDARMGAEIYQLYTVNMENGLEKREYWESLQVEPLEAPCTARSIIYNVMSMAGLAVAMFKGLVREQSVPRTIGINLNSFTPSWIVYRDSGEPTMVIAPRRKKRPRRRS